MNNILIIIGAILIVVATVIGGISIAVAIGAKDVINHYETVEGSIQRAFNPEAQDEYETAVMVYGLGWIGIVINALLGLAGIILFIIGIAIPSPEKEKVEDDEEEVIVVKKRRKPESNTKSIPKNYHCHYCGKVVRYIPEKMEWFCDHCRRYINIEDG